jgi:hypothetical protein
MSNSNPNDGAQGTTWRNWAGNVSSMPDEILKPKSLAEVQEIVRGRDGNKIRVVGTGHSFSPLVVSNGQTIVDLSEYLEGGRKAWRWQKDGKNFVSILPSARWAEVRDALMTTSSPLPRMYMTSTGALASINAVGFLAAGCHGTGWNQPTVSDFITEIEFVGADGNVHVFSDEATSNEMPAARVSLGMLGIITRVTLGVEPVFKLLDEEIVVPTENIMGYNPSSTGGEIRTTNLHKLLVENEYVELFWFPGSGYNNGSIWVKKFNRTEQDIRDVPLRPDGWIDQYADTVMGWTASNPIFWNIVLPLTWRTIHDRCSAIEATKGFVGEAPRVFFYADRAFPILDLEVAIPIPKTGNNTWDVSNVVYAWYSALNYTYANQGSFPLTTCLHARFTRSSQSLLSAAYSPNSEDRVCWIEILSAYPKDEPDPQKRTSAMGAHLEMIERVVADWIRERKGRPHWAKNWQYLQPVPRIRDMFPTENLRAFDTVRKRLDPDGTFINAFLQNQSLFS